MNNGVTEKLNATMEVNYRGLGSLTENRTELEMAELNCYFPLCSVNEQGH